MPFIQENAWGYLVRSFDFGRQFFYIWTVNWHMLPEPTFLSKELALFLLAVHLVLLLVFLYFKWCKDEGGVLNVIWPLWKRPSNKPLNPDRKDFTSAVFSLTPSHMPQTNHIPNSSSPLRPNYYLDIVNLLFVGNFIGILCARSLHFQFYVWYYHTLPYLLWHTPYPTILRYPFTLYVHG